MSHPRKIIRDAFVAALTGLPLTGDHVFPNRTYPLPVEKTPGICVHVTRESVDYTTMTPRIQRRQIEVAVDVHVAEGAQSDDQLDAACLAVENAVTGSAGIRAVTKDVIFRSTEMDFLGFGEKQAGYARLLYLCEYFCYDNAIETLV